MSKHQKSNLYSLRWIHLVDTEGLHEPTTLNMAENLACLKFKIGCVFKLVEQSTLVLLDTVPDFQHFPCTRTRLSQSHHTPCED